MATASGEGLTVGQIEGRLNRLEARRGTRFNVVSALAVGLLSAVATLGGVWLGTSQTADAEDARADEDFAREQRIETYGEFLGRIDATNALTQPFTPTKEQFLKTPLKDLNSPTAEQYREIVESLPPITTLSGQIGIIGGEQVPQEAGLLAADIMHGAGVIRGIYRCHNEYEVQIGCTQPPSALYSPGVTPEGPQHTYLDIAADRQDFLESVTSQLGLPDS